MNEQAEAIERVQAIKAKHEADLLAKANVVGVGIGYRQRDQVHTDEVVLVVMVRRKVPRDQLKAQDLIPQQIEGVTVDVQAVGRIEPQG